MVLEGYIVYHALKDRVSPFRLSLIDTTKPLNKMLTEATLWLRNNGW